MVPSGIVVSVGSSGMDESWSLSPAELLSGDMMYSHGSNWSLTLPRCCYFPLFSQAGDFFRMLMKNLRVEI